MLSAKELHDIRTCRNDPKPLPSGAGKKDFTPTQSPEELSSIDAMLRERMSCMKEERVIKRNSLSTASWHPDVGSAEVTLKLGSIWESIGFTDRISGKTHLYPEEALFLLEIGGIELSYSGTPLSIQHAYSLLLNGRYCTVEKYRVYSHLRRQGYRLLRTNQRVPKTKRTVDSRPLLPSKKARTDTNDFKIEREQAKKLLFQCPAADSMDLSLIPDFSSSNPSVRITFSDTTLLPESCITRRDSYVLLKKDFFKCDSQLEKVSIPKERVGFSDSVENVLFRGITKPLLCQNDLKSGDIYSRLKIFSKASGVPEDHGTLEIAFDIFSPGVAFRKSDPGTPTHSVVATTWAANFPSFLLLEQMRKQLDPLTVLVIAVVGQGSDISYYQLETSSVSLNPDQCKPFMISNI